MKTRNHKILDHPILGYFLLMIFSLIVSSIISSFIDSKLLGTLIPGYAIEKEVYGKVIVQASGLGNAVGSVLAIGLFYIWFRPYFDGMLKKKYFFQGLLFLAPVLLIHWVGSVVSWTQFGMGSIFLAFLKAFAPGFAEETAFRGLGVANYLRKVQTEKGVVTIFWLSSIVFGLSHVANVFAGAPLLISIGQAAYAAGIGMILGAVYLRTGNLWPTILGHMSVDFMEFIRGDLGSSGGIMSGIGVGDWITIVDGVVGIILGLYLIRPSKRAEIVDLWKAKWISSN
ncbi:MAG: CPBP family intramembrane metalloprotease [Lachnospiraceae bacterium]|nr:CPBP family intramembrane metalloprotease [Lachnospiraceae bacterium]